MDLSCLTEIENVSHIHKSKFSSSHLGKKTHTHTRMHTQQVAFILMIFIYPIDLKYFFKHGINTANIEISYFPGIKSLTSNVRFLVSALLSLD